MADTERFRFAIADSTLGNASLLPFLPLTISLGGGAVQASGLLDTGASVNVLPFAIGEELGAVWEEQIVPIRLTGNLAHHEARVLVVSTVVATFDPVRLAFA